MSGFATAFPLSGPINLLVRLGHGSLTVTAQDDLPEAAVELTPRDPASDIVDRTTVEMQGSTLTVLAPRQGGLPDLLGGWRRDRDAVDARVVVPTGTAMKLATAGADITVTGRAGGADVATGAATITLDTIDGDLRLRYGSATSRVNAVTGSVVVRAGAGDAHFGAVGGDVQAGTGSGNLDIDRVGGAIRARAGSGNARLGQVFGDVDLVAGSGRIDIGLPGGVSAKVDVTTGSGRVDSELPVDKVATAATRITVRARTGSGDVRLFRAA